MKNIYTITFIAIILIAFTHCKKEEPKTLSVSPTRVGVSKDGYSNNITVNTNTDWNATSNKTWCILDNASGIGNEGVSNTSLFGVTISANTTTSERTAIITVSGTNVSSITITVIQEAGDEDFIEVITPTNSSNWEIEQTYNIEWNDNISENVKIELYENTTFLKTITSSTESNGNYSWLLPSDLTHNSNYKIKIISISESNISAYSDNFTINIPSDMYYMTNSTETLSGGTFYDSHGANNYFDNEDYTMTFYPETSDEKLQFNFTFFNVEYENDCSYDYLIIYDGSSSYASLIGVYCGTNSPETITASNSEGALTFVFHSDGRTVEQGWEADISCVGGSSDYITITSPTSSSNWEVGQTYTIQWNDNISENVRIRLWKGSDIITTITTNTASDGSYSWSIPSSISNDNYYIVVGSVNNTNLYGVSDYFTISDGVATYNLDGYWEHPTYSEYKLYISGSTCYFISGDFCLNPNDIKLRNITYTGNGTEHSWSCDAIWCFGNIPEWGDSNTGLITHEGYEDEEIRISAGTARDGEYYDYEGKPWIRSSK